MNVAIEKHLATILENKFIELFDELEVLGMYTYIRMMIDQETTTVPVIIDKLIEKFNIENDFVLFVLKKLEASGALMIVKNKEN
jgi:hypothetical protein